MGRTSNLLVTRRMNSLHGCQDLRVEEVISQEVVFWGEGVDE